MVGSCRKKVLTNENYTGTLVQGREEKVNYKVNKSVMKPEDEWIKVNDAHEAIISKEDFEIVQDLLRIDTRAYSGEEKAHILFRTLVLWGLYGADAA